MSVHDELYPHGIHRSLEGWEKDLAERWIELNDTDTYVDGTPIYSGVDGVKKISESVYFVSTCGHGWYCLESGQTIGEEDCGIELEWQGKLGVDKRGVQVGEPE